MIAGPFIDNLEQSLAKAREKKIKVFKARFVFQQIK